MSDKKDIKLYSIHSLKGGVGKSTIALMVGCYHARQGKKTVIIDADLSGTSLVDLDIFQIWDSKQKTWLSMEKSKIRLKDNPRSCQNNFINDYLLCDPGKFIYYPFLDLLWSSSFGGLGKTLFLMPSSPLSKEIKTIVPYLYEEDSLGYFRSRFEELIKSLVSQKFEVLVIDTSPGLWGMSIGILKLINEIKADPFILNKGLCLISSEDSNDYRTLFRYADDLLTEEKTDERIIIPLNIIFNRLYSELGTKFNKKIGDDLSISCILKSERFKGNNLKKFIGNSIQIPEKAENKIERISTFSREDLGNYIERIKLESKTS